MPDLLYYDSRCPLCRREIALLERLCDDGLAFVDIHGVEGEMGPGRDELLRRLHLRRATGQMITGLEANVAVWQHTSFGFAWRLLLLPGIRPLAEALYDRWAQRRYRRLYGCAIADRCSE